MTVRRMLLGSCLALGLAIPAGAGTADAEPRQPYQSGVYRNPMLNRDFPDPAVVKAHDGWYYAYATQKWTERTRVNIQVARSDDLQHWTYLGEALPKLPRWGDDAEVSWAPQVVRRGGRYLLYYSTVPDRRQDEFGLCLAVATSRSPAGPFRGTRKPLYCGPTYADIDANVFHDPVTGDWRVSWGSGGDIVTARLAPSLTRLAHPRAEPRLLLRGWSAKVERPYEHGIEGPVMHYRRGWYYLLYSGDNCCSYPPHYATMAARSRHATGPYTRLASTRPGRSSVILHANGRWAGPGHGTVVTDEVGQDWFVYHAIDRRNRFIPATDGAVRRPMLADRIEYRKGWPVMARRSPSTWRKPAPVVHIR